MNPYLLIHQAKQQRLTINVAIIATLISAIALLAISFSVRSRSARIMSSASALAFGLMCSWQLSICKQNDRKFQEIAAAESWAWRDFLREKPGPGPGLREIEPDANLLALPGVSDIELFDWSQIKNQPDRYPHLLLCGETGSGKSTTAEHLMSYLAQDTLIISPHRKPGDWHGVPVVGSGRNYRAIESTIIALEDEMSDRYKLYERGDFSYRQQTIIIDEFGSIASHCKDAMSAIHALLQEARKVKMRLIILAHSQSVELLEMKGKGDLRKCFKKIRLGSFAIGHAKTLKNEKLIEYCKAQKFPAMVEDYPADLSELASLARQFIPISLNDCLPENESIEPEYSSLNRLLQSEDEPLDLSLLDSPLKEIAEYSDRKGWISPSQCKSSIAKLRDIPASEIRSYIEKLLELGYGASRQIGKSWQWSLNPQD